MVCLGLIPASPGRAADAQPAVYRVRGGDNLTVIAARYGTTVDRLRRDNDLRGDLIRVGQQLRLTAPFTAAGRVPRWQTPLAHPGPVLRPFGPYKAGGISMRRTGVELDCAPGTALTAPADGVVRFSGAMDGYGHLLILQHGAGWATVLGPCDPGALKVGVGDAVRAGDALGRTAPPPDPDTRPYVHLELRRHDEAVAPDRLHR